MSHPHSGESAARPEPDLSSLSFRSLTWALAINAIFLVVEIIGGIMANSLALLADAGHMATDVAALILALLVAVLARRPPTPKRTFGLHRAEVLGAFVNGSLLVLIVGLILWEAWRRLGRPLPVNGPLLLLVAVAGLAANLASAGILYRHRRADLNLRAAFLHMLADALGSGAAIVAGAVIWISGWTPIDLIVSVVIGVLILWSSLGLLKQTLAILLEATPEHINYQEVLEALQSLEHVEEVHDLHIWTIASAIPALSAHLRLRADCCDTPHWQACLRSAQDLLRERFGIVHSTLQMEPMNYTKDGRAI